MTNHTVNTSPNRRLVFSNSGVHIEEKQEQDVGTSWERLATLSNKEVEQLYKELETAGYPI